MYTKGLMRMTEKPLGLKPLDYHADITNLVEPIIDLDNPTKQEEYIKKRIIEALEDCPKKKVGYLVMEMKDKGDVE